LVLKELNGKGRDGGGGSARQRCLKGAGGAGEELKQINNPRVQLAKTKSAKRGRGPLSKSNCPWESKNVGNRPIATTDVLLKHRKGKRRARH